MVARRHLDLQDFQRNKGIGLKKVFLAECFLFLLFSIVAFTFIKYYNYIWGILHFYMSTFVLDFDS